MNQSAFDFYFGVTEKYSRLLSHVSGRLKWFGIYRLVSFLLIFSPLLFGLNVGLTVASMLLFLVLFFWLVKENIGLEKKKENYKLLKKIADDELLALNHHFLHFEDGNEFLDTGHFYSYDLDLFGEGSLFQFINRTATQSGKKRLAHWLKNPPFQKEEILKRQAAVKELSNIPEWRLYFLAKGHLFKETAEMSDEIKSWSATELKLEHASKIKWLINVIPLLTVATAVLAIAGITDLALYFMIFAQWFLLYRFRKPISLYFDFFEKKSSVFSKYVQLLEYIENHEFQSEFLVELHKKVKHPVSASLIFRHLKKGVKEFEYRANLIVGFVLNSIFLWDIRSVYKLWKWQNQHHEKLAVWLEVIAEMDALISLANLAHNSPDYIFPEIKEEGFVFQAEKLGHPLLHPKKRVDNDLTIDGWSQVLIITGANMAGKSTFLRAVGVNLVLARTGAPVCAGEMIFTPIEIYTNMRTTDSLLKDESYFFAELRRIKTVLDKLQNGERIFVILDEILKGTNSVDKLNGSKKLIHRLVELNSVSLIATHDLKLSELENEFPQQVHNKCFEIRIENNELVFDYKLSDGATKTMNATFLMKKMGIIN